MANQAPEVGLPQEKIAQVIGNMHLQILMLQEEIEQLKRKKQNEKTI